ncbi:class D sortase [Clostridium botulinum]|uniref:class D sortase n=1 Tax=Clostridium botulinum TaxID=1491 RepID=UPI00077462C2|nr:class D sortase [Clostridium botulinum]NFL88142.1 class D sortase [Clostridium botulinum]NFO22865.1 class D sortase [Clostridium botulinum]HBJ2623688.1 class D sortase [Clostridium botulinum]
MRFKKTIIGFILVISILLSMKLIKGYIDNLEIKETRVETIEKLNKEFDNEIKQQQQLTVKQWESKTDLKLENVIGKIIIDKLNLDYPILSGSTEENLNISITKFYGSNINCVGNCVLAGHNMKDGSLFGRLSELSEGDNIILYDTSGNEKTYKVFNIKVVDPTDLSVLSQLTDKNRIVTLITCTNQGKSRLILQAKEY